MQCCFTLDYVIQFLYLKNNAIDQGSSNLSQEGQSSAEFSSNPDQTHLPVIFLMILKTLISMLRCV